MRARGQKRGRCTQTFAAHPVLRVICELNSSLRDTHFPCNTADMEIRPALPASQRTRRHLHALHATYAAPRRGLARKLKNLFPNVRFISLTKRAVVKTFETVAFRCCSKNGRSRYLTGVCVACGPEEYFKNFASQFDLWSFSYQTDRVLDHLRIVFVSFLLAC